MIDRIVLVGQVGGVVVYLKPIAEVAHRHGYSASYIKRLCNEGKLIAHKMSNRWFVEVNLSEVESLTSLLDTS